jgi:hypothetical protein
VLRFRFELRPLDEVRPIGDPPHLSWFWLTDGWYWIDVDGVELFRYTPATLAWLTAEGTPPARPYADYHVVRFWEDLQSVLPWALEPVPADLVAFVDEDLELAVDWYAEHQLASIHFGVFPLLRFSRVVDGTADELHLAWQHPDTPDDPVQFDAPLTGRTSLATDAFLDAVRSFDRALLQAMADRIDQIRRGELADAIAVDLDSLDQEQADRSTWTERAIGADPGTEWELVRAGVAALRRLPG